MRLLMPVVETENSGFDFFNLLLNLQEKVEKAISKKFDYVRSALEIDPE